MSLIIDGILSQKAPLGLGAARSFDFDRTGVMRHRFPPLCCGSLSADVGLNAGFRWWCDALDGGSSSQKGGATKIRVEAETSPGVLFSSGLIAGERSPELVLR